MHDNSDRGYADVLVGLQYGDEGKAKIIDLLAADYDVIARFNGGANAGHTIDSPAGRVVLQQVPSGVFHPHCQLYIGSGCALNLWKLRNELQLIRSTGVDLSGRLVISDRCAVVQPAHFIVDELNGGDIGTTKNGIGPAYADRAFRVRNGARTNLQLRDVLADPEQAKAAMLAAAEAELDRYGAGATSLRRTQLDHLDSLTDCLDGIREFVTTDRSYLGQRVAAGARVLFEGAQSLMLDVVQGDQPFVTASHTVPGHAYVGGDLPPQYHRYTIGVAKAVVSRVGNGPFPSELGAERSEAYFTEACRSSRGKAEERADYDARALLSSADPMELGIALRMLTHEYGSGTGRPRRIGMLDLNQLRDMVTSFGVDVVYLNKVDCLSLYKDSLYRGIPVQVAATRIEVLPPIDLDDLTQDGLRELRTFVERELGVPIIGVGLGPERDKTLQFFQLGGDQERRKVTA
ncbi:adenylosuccinate synthetase [Acrocarpospora corrugata]|uniref:Adenylosuccinate synthetase n=1 Tax=Acrocarpospora corrugata TaxID=35763 RepID=A0A5M3W210_9ACTN|nr:adenylosuccinate synthetase [Acrocarpospora corrugata]GES03137.1 adenylosuccinate synthetase [Acrocarpospora corrugata]